ncbi:MAG: hypothetical protein C4343_07880, partial [Chloroflexota bacterium]
MTDGRRPVQAARSALLLDLGRTLVDVEPPADDSAALVEIRRIFPAAGGDSITWPERAARGQRWRSSQPEASTRPGRAFGWVGCCQRPDVQLIVGVVGALGSSTHDARSRAGRW